MVGRSRRLFWRDLVRSRKRETVRNGHELVLSPSIGVVVKALPERSQTPLNLAHVNVHTSCKGRVASERIPAVVAPLVY